MKITKKQWKALLDRHPRILKHWTRCEGDGWETVLPVYDERGKPVTIDPIPFVLVPRRHVKWIQKILNRHRLRLNNALLNTVPGYHYAKNESLFLLCRPGDDWWQHHPVEDK